MKTIIEKLIERNKDNLSSNEDDTDDDDDEEDDEAESSAKGEDNGDNAELSEHTETPIRAQSVKSQRRQSTKSVNGKEKHEENAQAYFELEDDETALKYFKKYLVKSEESLKGSWSNTTIRDEQLPVVKFFRSLLTHNITAVVLSSSKSKDISNKDVWTNVLQAYVQMFTIATRTGDSSNEMTRVYFAAFCICQELYDMPDNLTNAFNLLFKGDSNGLQWKQLISLLPPDEWTVVLMRIAAHHISNDAWQDALEICRTLQDTIQKKETLKSAVNYGLLKLFQLHLVPDEKYRTNIMAVNIRSTNMSIFDRILLCRLIISFMEALEDETTANTFEKELLILQIEAWTIVDLETTNCIGHVLTKVEDHALASLYWNELQNIYNEMLPKFIVSRVYSTDSDFEQILRAVQEMNSDLFDNILSLAASYESIATYEEKDDNYEDAGGSFKKAIVI
ncbi:unnamed protein product [Didymodactylos carnosus]|uniref:Uncharacterized protein n=1 Tax=Didymodactylos carnosus TaxID=1234261 RepID=A0A814TBJ8_9BILA|nr:unnamed protein product [Didymodactylos carnosus]CAF1159460.1 unnamed protein product [Didymodactylos carnosus]CAF3895791.1 unnamed protein product [Didymodactylos carnosus]CAF3922938.1 unnamed protein product [Didymodactylos carnosus]